MATIQLSSGETLDTDTVLKAEFSEKGAKREATWNGEPVLLEQDPLLITLKDGKVIKRLDKEARDVANQLQDASAGVFWKSKDS